jgi:hypothetical protein
LKGSALVKAAFSQNLEFTALRKANNRISNELTRVTNIAAKSDKSSSHVHPKQKIKRYETTKSTLLNFPQVRLACFTLGR